MKNRNQYLKVIEWSEEDQCFIDRVPGLARWQMVQSPFGIYFDGKFAVS